MFPTALHCETVRLVIRKHLFLYFLTCNFNTLDSLIRFVKVIESFTIMVHSQVKHMSLINPLVSLCTFKYSKTSCHQFTTKCETFDGIVTIPSVGEIFTSKEQQAKVGGDVMTQFLAAPQESCHRV